MKKYVILAASANVAEVIAHPTEDGAFMILLSNDLTAIHPGLKNLDNTGIDRIKVNEQFIDIVKKREMIASIPFTLSVLSQAGNKIVFDVEEIVVGDMIVDNNGKPVLDENGNPRKYMGRADGSSKEGEIMHRVANMLVEVGDQGKAMIDYNRQQVEIAVATASAKEYKSVRAERPARVRHIPSWAITPEDQSGAKDGHQENPTRQTLTPEDIAGGAGGGN